ncbi:MAG: hypothetical protein HY820_35875 [Acidobacteria bacterium]|nr:hypothetical protein [Acidobacteriota bacterium]
MPEDTPKQGDHVFNAIETAILGPVETIRGLRSAIVDGQHFLHDYLLISYSLARRIADSPALVAARKYVASGGAEEDAVREIAALRTRRPKLARITPALLRDMHQRNATQFGAAAERFELEALSTVIQALEAAIAPRTGGAARTASPGIGRDCGDPGPAGDVERAVHGFPGRPSDGYVEDDRANPRDVDATRHLQDARLDVCHVHQGRDRAEEEAAADG